MAPAAAKQKVLSTEPPSTGERRLAFVVVLLSAVIFIALAPFARTPLPVVWVFNPLCQSALATSGLVTVALLYAQSRALRSPSLLVLAGGYLFIALIACVHTLMFPSVFAERELLDARPQSALWVYLFWHGLFPLFVLVFARTKENNADSTPRPPLRGSIVVSVVAVLVLVAGIAAPAAAGHGLLPAIVEDNRHTSLIIIPALLVWISSLAAIVTLWRRKPHSTLDLWLMVVMGVWFFSTVLTLGLSQGRFDLGYYAGRVYSLLATSVVLWALLLEYGRLHARVAEAQREVAAHVRDLERAQRALEEDTAARKRAERLLIESEARLRSLTELSSDWYWEQDEHLRFVTNAANPAGESAQNTGAESGKALWECDLLGVTEARWCEYRETLTARKPFRDFEYQRRAADGQIRYISLSGTPLFDENGVFRGYRGIGRDITDRKRAQERITYLAQFDVLTSLPNRHMFHDSLSQTIEQTRRLGGRMACLFIDLDRFKDINDTFGHSIGDKLLFQVAERLRRCVRSGDTIGRLGGDEFAVALGKVMDAYDAVAVAQKVLATLAEPFNLEGHRRYVSASIGIALYPGDGATVEELLRNADIAMYHAKETGRNNHQFYLPTMNQRVAQRAHLEAGLRGALERNEFVLYYQPKVKLASGTISGFEALLRWRHPEHGWILPAEFIPALERTGLIVPVGAWVLETVCMQIQSWQKQGITPLPVAVNLSGRQLQQKDFDRKLHDIISHHGGNFALIKLEITESMLMRDPDEAARMLRKLKKATGVAISVDDFGTGYSSLAYLKRFPLDELKIDSAFIRDVTTDPDDAEIALAIISLAHNLNLSVVAEGVETDAQFNFLRSHGCDEIQGYYFEQPIDADSCAQALAVNRRLFVPIPGEESDGLAVLLVDDNPDDLELLRRMLKPEGYRVLTAVSVHAAFDVLAKHRVSVVISDYNMPGMTGVKFLSRVRTQYPGVVRIVISGASDANVVTEAVNQAAVHKYLFKTWDASKVRAAVREATVAVMKQAGSVASQASGRAEAK